MANVKDISRSQVIHGDCLSVLRDLPDDCVDLAYLDPPFFTGKDQRQRDRILHEGSILSFADVWASLDVYLEWVHLRLREVHRVLKNSGSVFLHCDWHANHLLRLELDRIFGPDQFRSEIIWVYRRWTNNTREFQRAHQTLYFYSKTDHYTFNQQYEDYSFTTNIDQIWQKRTRDSSGKAVTATTPDGQYIPLGKDKPGVPMRDVWEIPYLNPRAKERTGYPTQKPLELLRRVILAVTDPGDLVLDPMCGSGTTLVAAKALGRRWLGIDSSERAVTIATQRLNFKDNPLADIHHHEPYRLAHFLKLPRHEQVKHLALLLGMNIARRNGRIDGLIKQAHGDSYMPVKLVEGENLVEAVKELAEATRARHFDVAIAVVPHCTARDMALVRSSCISPVRVLLLSYEDILKPNFSLQGFIDAEQLALAIG